MNPYLEVVERLGDPLGRYKAAHEMSAGGRGARENRGKKLPSEKLEALIWGLSHESPVVRRCCLELLDQHPDEHATCYIVQGRGLVVISSCGHSGLINTINTAMAVTNVNQLHAVIGGFHLVMSAPEYISHTVDALEKLAPDVVVPMHCSGENFISLMRERMPETLVSSNVGSRFTFGV